MRGDSEKSGRTPRRLKGRTILIAVLIPVVLLQVLLALGVFSGGAKRLYEGPAPDFTLSLFGGGQLSLSELKGQLVVLNFWASWCPPCRDEAAALQAVSRQYEDRGVIFVGVAYKDTDVAAQDYLREFGVTYPNGPDSDGRIARAYGIQAAPETFFVDARGEIVEVFIGPLSEEQLAGILDRLLLGPDAEP
jgi:cytochrome c biogenesis protein CcmG/thiol:disulfide interchange protein DsbE